MDNLNQLKPVCPRKRPRSSRWLLECQRSPQTLSDYTPGSPPQGLQTGLWNVNLHGAFEPSRSESFITPLADQFQRTNPFLSHEHHTSYRHNNTPTKACATSVNQLARQWKKHTTHYKQQTLSHHTEDTTAGFPVQVFRGTSLWRNSE